MKLIIEDDEGRKTVVPFVREEITIGRQEGNTIRLTERNVSRRHARLMRQNGHVVVEDLGSSNGTRINGERISGQSTVKDGDLIQIGDYDLALQSDAQEGISTQRLRPSQSNAEDEPSEPNGSAAEPETEAEAPVEEQPEESAQAPGGADARRHSTAIINRDKVEGNRSRKIQELEAEEAPRLVVTSSELKGQEYACIRTEMKIGRTDDNDIVIDHRSLSRTHAKIVREDNGEWRILDMQSANGLTVNGETYAQSALNSGDIIELGHVKLRFIAAGEPPGALSSGGRQKLMMVLALVVLVLVGGAAAFFVFKPGPGTPGPVDQPPQTAQPDPIPTQPAPDTPPQPPPSNNVEPKPPTAAETEKKLAEYMEQARKSLTEGNLDKAWNDLAPAMENGAFPAKAQPLAREIEGERNARDALASARDAFTQQKYAEAKELLEPAKDSNRFRKDYIELVAKIDEALKEPPKPEPGKPPTSKPVQTANLEEEARQAREDAWKLLRAKQYIEIRPKAELCIERTPSDGECHLLMGISYAGAEEWKKAMPFYEKFLELAPDHKFAPKIRESLKQIRAQEKGGK
ncbi:MAG TPA: FHA domain-containing protein [Hyalangium sp.]|nr:FHA domain-containing protein [Hyalangium sp.]